MKEKKIVKYKKEKFRSIDSYLSKIAKDFMIIPDENYGKIEISTFNNQIVYLWNINGKGCMLLTDLAKYIDVEYKSLNATFNRNKIRLEAERDYLQIVDKGRKRMVISYEGLLLLLSHIRSGLAQEFFEWWVRESAKVLQRNQLTTSQLFIMNKRKKLIPQNIGIKCWMDSKGYLMGSRGEMIISNILRRIGLKFQYSAPIHYAEGKFPLLADFLIRTTPKTILEYWGLENNPSYDSKRQWKSTIYENLGIRLIDIEAREVENELLLEEKIKKQLKNKKYPKLKIEKKDNIEDIFGTSR